MGRNPHRRVTKEAVRSFDGVTVSAMGFLLTIALLVDSLWTVVRAPVLGRAQVRTRSLTLLGQAILFAAAAGYLTYYAASEDSYRRGGISRWEAYDAPVLTVGAILACLAVCALAAVADRRRGRMVLLAGPAGLAAAILFAVAFAANSLNLVIPSAAEACRGLA